MAGASTAESLCTACGLCCNGLLFGQAPLQADEAAEGKRLGLVVITRPDGKHALRQPCAALSGCRCRVYEQRPQVCRTYECTLLPALASKEVSVEEARMIVRQVHDAADRISAALGDGPEQDDEPRSLRSRVHHRLGTRDASRLPPAVAEDLHRLEELLRLYFRWQRGR